MDGHIGIGDMLRRRREERGLTAEQAALQSKVPLRLMHALESGDYHLMPDPLYLVRFVHDYAVFLGLDVGAIDAEFERALHQPLRTPAGPAATPPTAPRVRWTRVPWPVGAGLAIAAIVAMVVFSMAKRGPDQEGVSRPSDTQRAEAGSAGGRAASAPDRASETLTQPSPAAAAPFADAPATPVAGTTVPPLAATGKTARPIGSSGHVLVVRAQEPTWLSVRADRKDRREVLLQVGQAARFEAETDFHIIVGNAGGVTLSFDGTPLPPLGRSGEVIRDLVLPPVRRDSSSPEAALPTSTQ